MAKYFTDAEIRGLQEELVVKLDQLRDSIGIPIFITCGYRSPAHNKSIGGVSNSAHTKGLAVDIRCHDSKTRFKMVKAAYEVGFRRIEVATKHLHLDVDLTKPHDVLWIDVSK